MKTFSKPRIRRVQLLALAGGMAIAAPLAPAFGSVTGFQLPPGDTPEAEGPVAEGVAPPRPVATATPTPSPTPRPAPTATATPTPTPTASPSPTPAPTPTPSPAETRPAPQPGATADPEPAPEENAEPEDEATEEELAPPEAEAPGGDVANVPIPAATAESLPASEPDSGADGIAWWPWIGGLALLAMLVGALVAGMRFWLRRRRAIPLGIPVVERPRVLPKPAFDPQPRPEPAPAPAPPPAPDEVDEAESGPLSLAIEVRQLAITLTAATLTYRITLTNSGAGPMTGIAIDGDMISAHSSLSRDDQLANEQSPLEQRHQIEMIPAGRSARVTGEMRLPLPAIRAIHKGEAALFVPLARFRVAAAQGAKGTVIQTVLVGQRSPRPGGGLQPFRLDFGPRIYPEVTQRIFS